MKTRRAIYPGSFDPVTFGHIDVIKRAANFVDEVIVAVAENENKKPLFTSDERTHMLMESLKDHPGVRVESFDCLLVDYAQERKVNVILRGLRAISDFEFEFQMALMNRRLKPNLETVFLTPSEDVTFLSSRLVKEVARLGGDVRQFVPEIAVQALAKKFAEK
ncbi:MAG: pantetheine-phosphate adenylyltransferase [Chthoniobacterales bacterium]